MKKKIVIIIVILLLLLCGTLIKFYPFGNTKYYLKEEKIYLNIPKLSIYETNENKNIVIFSSFRSKSSITNEFNKELKKYQKKTCHLRDYYYDKEDDIMIEEFVLLDSNIFKNKFYIKYGKGYYTNDFCNILTDYKTINYNYYHIPKEVKRKMEKKFQYLDIEDNKRYDVYTDCNNCLEIIKGMGYPGYFEDLLLSSYISMDTLLKFLDYQVSENKATKTNYQDGTFYKNNDFSLLKCNNKIIYMSDELEYNKNYCK